jgi:hypothetical protein
MLKEPGVQEWPGIRLQHVAQKALAFVPEQRGACARGRPGRGFEPAGRLSTRTPAAPARTLLPERSCRPGATLRFQASEQGVLLGSVHSASAPHRQRMGCAWVGRKPGKLAQPWTPAFCMRNSCSSCRIAQHVRRVNHGWRLLFIPLVSTRGHSGRYLAVDYACTGCMRPSMAMRA